MEMKRTQCRELISFFLVAMLLVICGSGSPSPYMGGGSSQVGGALSQMEGASSPQMGKASSPQMRETDDYAFDASSAVNPIDSSEITSGDGEDTVGVAVENWRGFATKEDESHPIRLNVEAIKSVDPAEARRLLALNISLEEVKSQARASERDVILRGSIRINNDSYRLIDITLAPSGNRSTLKASVASPGFRSGSEDEASIVGNTVVTISIIDEITVAEGYLAINDSKYSGTYSLLLNECSGRGPRAGMLGQR